MSYSKRVLITGGAGFIGSHAVRYFVNKYPDYQVVNFDALTYAGNLENLRDVESAPNYRFEKGDITDEAAVAALFDRYKFHTVIHLAAESHVDRSITDPGAFVRTNVFGTTVLLNAARTLWQSDEYAEARFYHISTDEVYGSLGAKGYFTEASPYDPRSPYSASKAAADHLVRAYGHTYGLPVLVSNCSNNYGPNQFPEKLIPLIINNIRNEKSLPVYGTGDNVRDWLYVEDHVRAMDAILHRGQIGETYLVGGRNEYRNIDLVRLLCRLTDSVLGREAGRAEQLITFVKDRAGHDKRYAIDATKLRKSIGWKPSVSTEEGFRKTIEWYLDNTEWLERVTSGAYRAYYERQYAI